MTAGAPLISEIEGLLVKEFQLCQDLLELTREERRALLIGDVHNLALLVERKEVLLDELTQIDEMHRMRRIMLAEKMDIPQPAVINAAELASYLPSKNSRRLLHLHRGILALNGEIKELTSGNQSLALAAAGRAFVLQRSLLDLTFRAASPHRASTL